MIKIVKKSIRLIKRYGFARAIVRIVAKILNVDLEFQEAKNKAWDIFCAKNTTTKLHMAHLRA
mgnify:CR=1 FL=1|jgi:hypothetical protein